MRCRDCNSALTDFEATIKTVEEPIEYIELCKKCIPYHEFSDGALEYRFDLLNKGETCAT